jgi:hypothetical protein
MHDLRLPPEAKAIKEWRWPLSGKRRWRLSGKSYVMVRIIAKTGGVLFALYVLGMGPIAIIIRGGYATADEVRFWTFAYAPLEWFMDHAPGGFILGCYLQLWAMLSGC